MDKLTMNPALNYNDAIKSVSQDMHEKSVEFRSIVLSLFLLKSNIALQLRGPTFGRIGEYKKWLPIAQIQL